MKTPFTVLFFLFFAGLLNAAETPPAGILIEAESPKPAGDSRIITDPNASGGKAVTSSKTGEVVFQADVPKGMPEMTVWIRHRGGAIGLKSAGGGPSEVWKWIYYRPKNWAWSNAGRYFKEMLGNKIILVRNVETDKLDPQVDCVVFSPDSNAKPAGDVTIYPQGLPPTQPEENVEPIKVDVKVDWNKIIGKMPPMIWGVADYEVFTPELAADKGFNAYLKSIRPAFIRIHWGYQEEEWIDSKMKTWNVKRIKAGFDAATGFQGAKIMMDINGWPKWLDPAGKDVLPPENEDKFVQLCVELVRLMRDQVKHRIDYWEFPNEKQTGYEDAGKLDDFWRLINKIAVAIKKEDPTCKVGGAAFNWNRPEWVKGLVDHCGQNIDFISWHNYAVGDMYVPTEEVFRRINDLARHARDTQTLLAQYPKKFETFITEYNINWTSTDWEPRQQSSIAAVFDACLLKRWALEGITGVAVWHVKNGTYGLIDIDWRGNGRNDAIKPGGYLYQWAIPYLVGQIADTQISNEPNLDCLPVITPNGKSLLLMNKSIGPVLVPGGGKLLNAEKHPVRVLRINNKGLSSLKELPSDIILPGYSVTLVTTIPEEKNR